MAQLFYLPQQPVLDIVGLPVAGALLSFFATGTTTFAPIYADAGLAQALPNPISADAFGRLPPVYLDDAVTYRLRVARPNGASLGPDVDPYIPTTDADLPALLAAKVDEYPANPHLPMVTGIQRLNAGWDRHFFDPVNHRIRPTSGDGGPNNGLPDTATPPSTWQMSVGLRTLYFRWRIAKATGDTVRQTGSATRISQQWTYFQTQYSASNMKTGLGGIVNTSDDGSVWAQALAIFHEVTADANALAYLVEFIANHNARFHDPHQTQIDYGVATPGGVAFKSDPLGILYSTATAIPSGDGYQNTSQEFATAGAAFYASQQLSLSAPLRAAMLAYAKNTWTWGFTYCRASTGKTDPITVQPADAIYFGGMYLDPTSAYYRKGNRFNSIGLCNAPVRGQSAYADGMTLMMAALSLRLSRVPGADPKYLAEAQAIVQSYPAPNGFGRTGPGGVPLIANARDPWVNGAYVPEYVLADWYEGTQGVATTGIAAAPLALAIYNSGQVISSALADGYTTPDWVGDEYCPATGYYRWTDEGGAGGQGGDPNQDYGGAYGGGQGTPRQLMTSTATLGVAQGAFLLEQVVQSQGSGIPTHQAIERLPARMAALELALSLLMPRSGGFFSDKFGLDFEFFLNRNTDPYINFAVGCLIQLYRAARQFTVYIDGDRALFGTYGMKVLDQVNFCTRLAGNTFYAGYGDGPYFNFGTGTLIQNSATRVRYEFYYGASTTLIGFWDGNGNFAAKGNIAFISDLGGSFGGPANRATQVYAQNATIQTSDATEKTLIGGTGAMSAAEIRVAVRLASMQKMYQWNDAIAEKGPTVARLHCGYIAQDVFAAFTAEGLDPHRYSCCCWDTWTAIPDQPEQAAVTEVPELKDKDGNVTQAHVAGRPYRPAVPGRAAGSRFSLRTDELNAFIAAGNNARLAALETAHAA